MVYLAEVALGLCTMPSVAKGEYIQQCVSIYAHPTHPTSHTHPHSHLTSPSFLTPPTPYTQPPTHSPITVVHPLQ